MLRKFEDPRALIPRLPFLSFFFFQLRIMEQQLAESQWSSPLEPSMVMGTPVVVAKEREVIHRLEGQVDEQRKMRLNDAKQVEAKAAKIKEWVTNKLREVRPSIRTPLPFRLLPGRTGGSNLRSIKNKRQRRQRTRLGA